MMKCTYAPIFLAVLSPGTYRKLIGKIQETDAKMAGIRVHRCKGTPGGAGAFKGAKFYVKGG